MKNIIRNQKDQNNQIVTKSNDLIKACFDFTLNEYRILLYAVSCINPKSREFERKIKINVKEFAKLFNISVDGLYTDLKHSITAKFFKRSIIFDSSGGKKELCHWLNKLIYHDGQAYLELEFSQDVVPYLSELKRNFTSFYIENIDSMKSIYSVRIYEYCIMELNKSRSNYCEIVLNLSVLKQRLCIESKYKDFRDFRRRVLEKSKVEINNYSDIEIDYRKVKRGRCVHSIKWIASRKQGKYPASYAKKLNHAQTATKEETADSAVVSQPQGALPQSQQNKNEASICDNGTNLSNLDAGCKRGYTEHQTLVAQMCKYGLKQKRALDLIEDYGAHFCEQGVAKIQKAIKDGYNINNSAAYLTTCITSSVELVKGSDEIKAEEQKEFIDEQLSCVALENILKNNFSKKTEALKA